MQTPDFQQLNTEIDRLIRSVSRDLLLPVFSRGVSQSLICYKQDNSVVTKIDIEAQAIFENALALLLPGSCVVGEEISDRKPDAAAFKKCEYSWIVDAVDGTHRFVASQPDFTTMVCLCRGDVPLYGWIYLPTEDRMFSGGTVVGVFDNGKPMKPDTTHKDAHDMIGTISAGSFKPFEDQVIRNCRAFHGLRNNLCAGYKFAGLLTGNLDFAAFGRAAPWDLAAGFVLTEALGGHAATWENRKLDMYAIWREKREWYLATRRREDWDRVNDILFEAVSMPVAI